jgi:hypothetical protein
VNYTKEEEQWVKDEKEIKEKEGWWKLPEQRLFVPCAVEAPLVKQQHKLTNVGKWLWKNYWKNTISFPSSLLWAPK